MAVMQYDVNYALMHIRLKRVAGATIKAAEGTWTSDGSEVAQPACMIDFEVISPETSGQVRLHKRTVCVLSMPGLGILRYVKMNNESIKPFLGAVRHSHYSEVYDFETGGVAYRRHDWITGSDGTNLVNRVDLARQAHEVADVLRTLYARYLDQPIMAGREGCCVHFNVEGEIVTFGLSTRRKETVVPALGRRVAALYAEVEPETGGKGRSESFSMWCMPFRHYAHATTNGPLQQLADDSLDCSMLPLSGEYALFLGTLQCTLSQVAVCP